MRCWMCFYLDFLKRNSSLQSSSHPVKNLETLRSIIYLKIGHLKPAVELMQPVQKVYMLILLAQQLQ